MGNIQKIGYCYVVGDILHRGHLTHLKNCKALCDILICGVLTEKAVIEKKPKPIISFAERLDIVGSIKYVDIAVCQNEYSPYENVRVIKPDILFESSSHEKPMLNPYGETIILPYYVEQSSSKIKGKIGNSNKKYK